MMFDHEPGQMNRSVAANLYNNFRKDDSKLQNPEVASRTDLTADPYARTSHH